MRENWKNWNIFKKDPPEEPDPHFGAHLWKSAWTPIFLAGPLLKFEYGYPKIDSSWDPDVVFPFRRVIDPDRLALRKQF